MHLVVGRDPGTLEFVVDISLLPLRVGSAIVAPLLMHLFLLLFLKEFPWWYPDDILWYLFECSRVCFLLIILVLFVDDSLDINSKPIGFNFGLLLLLLFFGWWLPNGSPVLGFHEHHLVLLNENVVEHLFRVDRRLAFRLFLGTVTIHHKRLENSVGCNGLSIESLFDASKARQPRSISILRRTARITRRFSIRMHT